MFNSLIPFNKIINRLAYKFNSERLFNKFDKRIPDLDFWEEKKVDRWMKFIGVSDLKNIEIIVKTLDSICEQNPGYTISLVAHGSSTYGKKNYNDIDIILEPSSGDRSLYDKLFFQLNDFFTVIPNVSTWKLQSNRRERMYNYNLIPVNGNLVQLSVSDCFFEGTKPLDGEELLKVFRNSGKSYVSLIIDNNYIY